MNECNLLTVSISMIIILLQQNGVVALFDIGCILSAQKYKRKYNIHFCTYNCIFARFCPFLLKKELSAKFENQMRVQHPKKNRKSVIQIKIGLESIFFVFTRCNIEVNAYSIQKRLVSVITKTFFYVPNLVSTHQDQ